MTHAVGLPRGWAATELGQVRVDLSRALDPRQYPDEDFELYSVPSFADGEPEIVRGSAIGSTKMTLTPGTVVVCKINPRINRVWVVGDRSPHKKIGSGEWIPFFPVEGVTPHFLAYYLQRDHFRNFLAARVSGVGGSLMRVRPTTLDEYPLPIPSVSEQQRIVEAIESYLTQLDNAGALLERVEQNLKRYRASVLKAAVEGRLVPTEAELARREGRSYEPASGLLKRILAERKTRWIEDAAEKACARAEEKAHKAGQPWAATDNAATLEKERAKAAKQYKEPTAPDTTNLPELPEGWYWASIGVCFPVEIGATPRRDVPEYWSGGISWVSSGEVAFCRIRTTRESISPEGLANTSTHLNPAGTVLIGMIGEGRTRGQVAILDTPACNNQNAAAIWVGATDCVPEYVYYYLMSQYEQTRRRGSGGNQPALNKARVQAIPLPLPPADEQRRIAERIEVLFEVAELGDAEVRHASGRGTRLRQSILKWAFEGKLVDQDPNDEPASLLLDRIRSERAGR